MTVSHSLCRHVSSGYIRPQSRVIYASDARTQGKVTGMRLLLPSSTDELITTAIWQVSVPDEAPFDVQHVIQWILPSPLASLMSDDTWLWPSVPGTPALSAGDWPVMDTDPSTLRRVRRRSFSIIDNRNRKGYITRRYQCFPLAHYLKTENTTAFLTLCSTRAGDNKMQRKTLLAALIAILNGTAYQAHAYSVTVVASRPVEQQVVPRMEAIKGVLSDILSTQTATGTAINQNSEKLASVIAQNGQATRQQMIFSNETQRLEEARKSFTVPDSICSESASGIATESKSASASAASKLSKGGGVSNRSIRDRLASAANSPVREAYDGAAIHASYCTEAEYARFGGTAVCPSVGEIPGGDSQVRSIYHGAGTADTPAALTWDQKQIDAATAYMKNTSRPSAGRALGKGEVNTQSGRTYVGLQNEYNGIIDSASNPQLTLIADSTPNESTRKALAETLQSDSAAAYFDQVASPEAKARGYMSTREFEAFEAGRRYANTAYLVDLQEMQGDNLLRELVRITAQMNWQLNDLKEQIRQGNVISGQQLALTARQYYEKQLGSLEKTINQANAR
nr:hypothetical protein KADIGFNM_00029 [Salmonella enterica subsp. enterica serovar London]